MTIAPLPTRRPAVPATKAKRRPFVAGSSGWTFDDLADPHNAHHFDVDDLELCDGVLTPMPPAGFQGVAPTSGLRRVLDRADDDRRLGGQVHTDCDVLFRPDRIPKPDLIYLTAEQFARHSAIERGKSLQPRQYRPVFVVPLLIVETISAGYVRKDRVVRRAWYAEAGVRHYWMLDPLDRSLECLLLDGAEYRQEAVGRGRGAVVRSSIFGGLDVPIADVWRD